MKAAAILLVSALMVTVTLAGDHGEFGTRSASLAVQKSPNLYTVLLKGVD